LSWRAMNARLRPGGGQGLGIVVCLGKSTG
jgi:hypothetical protein